MSRSAALRAAAPSWDAALAHPFVRGLGDGSLDEAAFRFYIRQDYLFLIDYGRLLSLGAARAPRLSWMRTFAALASSVLETEMALHREFAARWGVVGSRVRASRRPRPPPTATSCCARRRWATSRELAAAVLPCMWSYAEIGASLSSSASSDRYREWIDMYASSEFARAGGVGAVGGRRGRPATGMEAAFEASCAHEVAFWDAAFNAGGAAPARRPGAA